MRRPLLISDVDWARSLCGDGAVYFRYGDAVDAAGCIVQLIRDEGVRARYVESGARMLRGYPTPEQRFDQYLRIIERFGANHGRTLHPVSSEYVR